MRRWIPRLLIAAALIAAAVFFISRSLRPKVIEVTVTEAVLGRVEETVSNSRAGTVKARRRAKISPELGGTAVDIPFREGAHVKLGDVLLRLDDSLYRAQLALAERDLATARAERERTCLIADRSERERVRLAKLGGEGIVSTDLLDQAESQAATSAAACRTAATGIDRALANVTIARTQMEKLVLLAPFDGIVADVSIEVGEWTTPSPPAMPVPPVIDLIDPSSIYVSAPMDEVDSARILAGQAARVTVDSYRNRTFPAHVARVAPYVLDAVEQNRTVEIDAEVDDRSISSTFLPGTSADVEVILDVRENVLRLPASTLLEGERVLVVEGDQLVERKLQLGISNWDFVEVVSGLSAGEKVVTSLDRDGVAAGARVRVDEAAP